MFKFEKEMIPVLKKGLSLKYKTDFIVEEFFSGNGKADLVFSSDIFFHNQHRFDFEQTFYLTNFVNKKSKFKIDELSLKHNLKKEKLKILIDHLITLDYLGEVDGFFYMKRKYDPPVKNLISVEAKLRNWKEGFYQALRYKYYSHKSFLAICSCYVKNVDIKMLKAFRIGLISVDVDEIKIIYNPPKGIPLDTTAYYFLASEFATTVKR